MDIALHHPLPDPDFLAIEDLLDFSNEDINTTNLNNHHQNSSPIEPNPSSSIASSTITSNSPHSNPTPLHDPPAPAPPPPPPVVEKKPPFATFDSSFIPCDELAELEWLSNFVEESFSSCGPLDSSADCCGTLRSTREKMGSSGFNHAKSAQSSFGEEMCGQVSGHRRGRPRTKRHRTTPACFWNSRILSEDASESIIVESSYSTTTSTNTAITATSSDSDMFSTYYDRDDDENDEAEEDDGDEEEDDVDDEHLLCGRQIKAIVNAKYVEGKKFHRLNEPESKRAKSNARSMMNKGPPKGEKAKVQDEAPVRKCLHCATQKTPQWRAGPMGPKTLCNACGVRYKSGRLCPEYRPSASPTFNEKVHSNSHRRVIEMRRQRGELIG